MRTRNLLLTAALGLATAVPTMAQVYSANAVGYVNMSFAAGSWSLKANPLNNQKDNKIGTLFANAPDDVMIYKWTGTTWKIVTRAFGAWDDETVVLDPGAGFWVYNPTAAAYNETLVGEVMQGSPITPSVAVPTGWSLLGSQVPQKAALTTVMQFPAIDDDMAYQWTGTTWQIATFAFGGWDTEPVIDVGEGFWLNRAGAAGTWSRTFTVN